MKKIYAVLTAVTVFLIIMGINLAFAGETVSKTFKLGATIPAIIGVNVPAPSAQTAGVSATSAKNQTVVEERIRDNEKVIFQSIVMK